MRPKICRVVSSYIDGERLIQQLECGTIASGKVGWDGQLATKRQCRPCTIERHERLEAKEADRKLEAKRESAYELKRVIGELGVRR